MLINRQPQPNNNILYNIPIISLDIIQQLLSRKLSTFLLPVYKIQNKMAAHGRFGADTDEMKFRQIFSWGRGRVL